MLQMEVRKPASSKVREKCIARVTWEPEAVQPDPSMDFSCIPMAAAGASLVGQSPLVTFVDFGHQLSGLRQWLKVGYPRDTEPQCWT